MSRGNNEFAAGSHARQVAMSFRLPDATKVWCLWGLLLTGVAAVAWPCVTFAQTNPDVAPVVNHVFPRVPREVTESLSRIREACEERRFTEAAALLSQLAQRLGAEDYFQLNPNSRVATGFRAELGRFVLQFGPELRTQFELLHGNESRETLEQAVIAQDLGKLTACSQLWFLADAGQEATLLMARLELDRSRPWHAIRRLRALTELPNARRTEPERSVLLARALSDVGESAAAQEVLEQLRGEQSDVTIQIAGSGVRLFDGSRPALEFLAAAGVARSARDESPSWLSYRGGSEHALKCSLPAQTATPAWTRVMDSQPWQQYEWVAQQAAHGTAIAPVLSPLALNEQIVARGTTGLLGVRMADGETIWEYPPEQLPPPVRWRADMDETAREALLRTWHTQNVWRDSSFGRLSSDGKRVFFVDQAETGEADSRISAARQAAGWRGAPQSAPPSSNVLVALDASREGAFIWMVGGATGHSSPELAGAFFLGPPLPVDGLLYAIAETAGRVRLFALSPDTGRVQWSLTLAELDTRTIVESPTRSFAGVAPHYARGILVCDTSAGGVVAVDLASRALLWGYQYRDAPDVRNATRNPLLGWPAAGDTPERWFDADVLIVGTQVLVAADDDELLCLDLESGALRWNRPRRDTLYLASAGDQLLLLVGTHRFTALRVSDGSHAWSPAEYVAIPGGGMPHGRGLFDGAFFYLPTTDPELLKIDIAQGAVVERRKTASPLGNLIMHGPVLISQTESVLTAFEAEPQTLVEGRLPSHPRRDMSQLVTGALLTQLANPDYFEREVATRELLARGDAAIPCLAKGAAGQDTEVAFRCSSALLQFLDAADSRLATRSRLELAALTSRAATRFAADAYARESRRRAAQALVRLPQLGATASPDGKSVTLSPTWSGGSDGLAQIGWLLQVESLELRHPSVDDAGIIVLARMPNVKSLNLNRSTVTSAALRHLTEWPKLETLLLQGTQVDDSSVEHLSRMRGLRGVNLINTRITAPGVARLRAELPNAKILY